MKGLSIEIESALQTIIEGLNYDFFYGIDEEGNSILVDPDKMRSLAASKVSSLKGGKKLLNRWNESINSPSEEKLRKYVEEIVSAGESSIVTLRKVLELKIDYDDLSPEKHNNAINAKPIILEAILEIDSELRDLRDKLETGDLDLAEKEFKLGYPERFANGEFFPIKDYYKKRFSSDGSIIIDPKSTEGDKIVLMDVPIILPEPPKNKKDILFSNYSEEDQYWRRVEPPNITTTNIYEYHEYIIEEFRRRREGVWFMNNGVPTYLTGNHYWALQWCKMLDDGQYMQYREVQRNLFYFLEATIVDTNCLGTLLGKSRRTGFTYAVLSILLNWGTSTKNAQYGMMSKSGADGEEAFSKLSYMFLSLPFWLRPIVRGRMDSTKELLFSQPLDSSKKSKKEHTADISEYLNTKMDWRNTKNGSYDSIKLDGYLFDECFKVERPNDAIVHMGMVSPTMMPNGKVVGKMFAGSTMGGFTKGGEEGILLINGSKYAERDPLTKKTATALYFYFIPAQDNMEEFTDKYGICHKETPEKPTYNIRGELIETGSNAYLDALEEQKRVQGDKAYNEQRRTYPRNVDDLMRDLSEGCVFNMEKLYEQKDHNDKTPEEQKYQIGNFEWEDGIRFSRVVFYPNPRGRFKVVWLPSVADGTEELANKIKKMGDKYYPLNDDVIRFGCDPFSVKGTQGSKGALHGKTMKFPSGGAPSNKFVVEYLFRPPDDTTFFEDVLKCVWYYGAPILIESNRIDLNRYFRNAGCRGFLMNRLDRETKDLSPNELEYGGQPMTSKDIIDSHMNAIGAWIENYVGRSTREQIRPIGEMGEMPFNDTILDWLHFNPEKRTPHDATISSGLAIMACQSDKYKRKKAKSNKPDITKIFKKYSNAGSISKSL